MKKNDTAVDVLTAVQKRMGTTLPNELITKCYEVEKQFLFEKDRSKPMETIKKYVEDFVDEEAT